MKEVSAAAEIQEATLPAKGGQYLTFVLNGEEYAINILKVQEIKSWTTVTAVPKSPGYMLGVINLRGSIVPVVSLRSRFDIDMTTADDKTAVVIVRDEREGIQKTIGLVVDHVSEVYQFSDEQIQSVGNISNGIDDNFIEGLAKTDDGLVIVLNLEQIIADGESTDTIQSSAES